MFHLITHLKTSYYITECKQTGKKGRTEGNTRKNVDMNSQFNFCFPISVTVYLQLIMFTVKTRCKSNLPLAFLTCLVGVQSQIFNSIFVLNVTLNSYLHLRHLHATSLGAKSFSFCICCVHFGYPVLYIIRRVWTCSYVFETIFQCHKYLLQCNMYSGTSYYENLKNSSNIKVPMYVFYHFHWLEASNIFNHIWTKKSFRITGLVITNGSWQYKTLNWSLANYSTN